LVKIPSSETLDFIKQWHLRKGFWEGDIQNALTTIPQFIQERIGPGPFLLTILGIFSSFLIKAKHRALYSIALVGIFVIIINSHYWFLPLSPLLYPDRAITVGMIVASFFIASAIGFLVFLITRAIKSKLLASYAILVAFIAIPLYGSSFLGKLSNNSEYLFLNSAYHTQITSEDLVAFQWITKNTGPEDVFMNNYVDAGIWIPGIAQRKVVINDSTPYELDEAIQASKTLKPSFVYIGAKAVYEDSFQIFNEEYSQNPQYELVFSSGKAKVYKVLK
jgi:hypothetical protein